MKKEPPSSQVNTVINMPLLRISYTTITSSTGRLVTLTNTFAKWLSQHYRSDHNQPGSSCALGVECKREDQQGAAGGQPAVTAFATATGLCGRLPTGSAALWWRSTAGQPDPRCSASSSSRRPLVPQDRLCAESKNQECATSVVVGHQGRQWSKTSIGRCLGLGGKFWAGQILWLFHCFIEWKGKKLKEKQIKRVKIGKKKGPDCISLTANVE